MNNNSAAGYRERMYERYGAERDGGDTTDDRGARAPYIQHLIRQYLPSDRAIQIFDLGCGSGTVLSLLQTAGYHSVSGVDISQEQVAKAQRLGIQGVQHGNLLSTLQGTDDAKFDLILAFDILEHLTKSELLALADEVHRVLKSNGRWLIQVPNAEALFGARIRYADWTHEQAFTRESLTQVLRIVGFRQVDCYEDQPIVHGLKSALRLCVWKIVRGVLRVCVAAETGSSGREYIFSQNLLAVADK